MLHFDYNLLIAIDNPPNIDSIEKYRMRTNI